MSDEPQEPQQPELPLTEEVPPQTDAEKEQMREQIEMLREQNERMLAALESRQQPQQPQNADPAITEFQAALYDPTHPQHAVARTAAMGLQALAGEVRTLKQELAASRSEDESLSGIPASYHAAVKEHMRKNPGDYGNLRACYRGMLGEGLIKPTKEEEDATRARIAGSRVAGAPALPAPSMEQQRKTDVEPRTMPRAEYLQKVIHNPSLRDERDAGKLILT